MKKAFISLIITSLVFFITIFVASSFKHDDQSINKVAMVTDFADVDDNSFNQQIYEGCKGWCDENKVPFAYYKPAGNSDSERRKSVELAIQRGYNIIYLPSYTYGYILAEYSVKYPDVAFIGIDMTANDLPSDYVPTDNVFCFSYREEIAGYLAGYAAVVEGYKKLGFLGGMKASSVMKFGYGYAQGINDAAVELGIKEDVELNYVYGGQFYGDSDITKYIDNWYKSNTEIVFSCGGSIYTSVALAAKDNGGKIIGVDVDQSFIIDRDYGKGICLTSAMKGVAETCRFSLQLMFEGYMDPESFCVLGLISSEDLNSNFVGLPLGTWSMEKFTVEQYRTLIDEILKGKRIVNSDTEVMPQFSKLIVHDYGSIK